MNRTIPLSLAVTLLLGSLCATGIMAQPRGGNRPAEGPVGSVSGTIIDGATGEALPRASISLHRSADSVLTTGAIAESNGSFTIQSVRPGRYYARISYVGFQKKIVEKIEITPEALQISLDRIALSADTSNNQITVEARRQFMTSDIDRTVYSTRDLLISKGGNATDVLRNIPSVEVDIDGKVSLRGSQNVVVHINGRPVPMTGDGLASFLRGLPADAVERIEVIPNPSAKYDPDGMSGIINIVLKQEGSRGLSGGINGGVGTRETYNLGANLSYGDGPWNIFGSYGFNHGTRNGSGVRFQENRLVSPVTILDQLSSDTNRFLSHVLNASVDYAFNRSHSLSLTGFAMKRDGERGGFTRYFEKNQSRELTERYDRATDGDNDGYGMDYRLAYKWAGETARHELTAELRYNIDNNDDQSSYRQQQLTLSETPINETPLLQRTRTENRTNTYSAQVDYMRPLEGGGRIETGYKGELEQLNNSLFSELFDYPTTSFLPDTRLNNTFEYNRQIHAVYAIYGHDFGGGFSAQAGLRAEQAMTTFDLKTTAETFDNDYFSLFPSAFMMYKPSDGLQVKASYSKRITRPYTGFLNPFASQDDPTFRQRGNPYLKPEYIHSYEFSATHFTDATTLTLTPYFRRTNDLIRRYGDLDSTGVATVSYYNFDKNDQYGADMIGTLKLGDRFNAFASFSAYQTVTDAGNVEAGLGSDAFAWSMRGNASVVIIDGLDLQMSYFYRSPMALEGGGEIGSFSMADAALQQKLFDNRARIGLRVSDIFNTMGFNIRRTDKDGAFSYERIPNSRTFVLTFSYNFGSADRRTPRRDRQPPQGGEMEGW